MNDKIAVFQNRSIRRMMVDGEWYFSVIDVIAVLTDSANPHDYWFKMKQRVHSEDGVELSTICRQLKLQAPDGKMRITDCANVKAMFRIIQSIPSPKAEPFKQWLAQVGYDRVQAKSPEMHEKRRKKNSVTQSSAEKIIFRRTMSFRKLGRAIMNNNISSFISHLSSLLKFKHDPVFYPAGSCSDFNSIKTNYKKQQYKGGFLYGN